MLGIGQASNRNWQKRQYRTDPEYRAKKLAEVADYQRRQVAADPDFITLRNLRAKVSKARSQIEAHEFAIRAKRRRIAELGEKLVELTREVSTLVKQRKGRKG